MHSEGRVDAQLFGNWIIRARVACGLTQKQLGHAIGVPPGKSTVYGMSEISRWEGGSRLCHNSRGDFVVRRVCELLKERQEAICRHLSGFADEVTALEKQAAYFLGVSSSSSPDAT